MPNSTTYCELSSEEEREAIGNREFVELLTLHHLGATLCGLKGSDIDLRFVTEDGRGACYDTHRPALGFVYQSAPSNAFVRADQPEDQRRYVALHECRHCWQFIRDVPLHTTEAEEADADGFAEHYLPKLRPILDAATDAALSTLARVALDAQPSNFAVRTKLNEVAETVVDEAGLNKADEVLFVDDPAQVRTSPTAEKRVEELVSRVTERVLDRYDVTVKKSGCGCGCGG